MMQEGKRARAGEATERPRKASRLEPPAVVPADFGCYHTTDSDNDSDGFLDVMLGDKGARDESPRGPCLKRPAGAAADSGCYGAVATASNNDSEQCIHFYCSPDEMDDIFAQIESSDYAPTCEHWMCRVTGRSNMLLCTECNSHHCAGAGLVDKDRPQGHAWLHARSDAHFFAVWYDDPNIGYCFWCKRNMNHGMKDREDMGKIMINDDAGGHATCLANGHGYVVRGIPNLGNTCYLNALVQCLLVLGKLRERMLGPDAPTGVLGTLLQDLFEETNRAYNMRRILDPTQLLAGICQGDSRFTGNNMQDSHELLLYLCSALGEEEKLKEPPGKQGSAPSAVTPTVTDFIFGGQLCVTRSCKCCSIESLSHDLFYDLSVSLPSKGTPAKSVVSSPMNTGLTSRRKIRINLFPAIKRIKEKNRATAEGGDDSQVPGSKLEDVFMEKAPKPLEVDSTEAEQIWQSKNVVHGPLETQKGDVPGEIIEVPVKAVDVLPHDILFDVQVQGMDEPTDDSFNLWNIGPSPLVSPSREKNELMASGSDVKKNDNAGFDESRIEVKENTYPVEITTEDKGKAWSSDIVYDEAEDISSLASIEDCLALHFKTEVIERFCENCHKVAEQLSANTSKDREQMVATTNENTAVDGDQTEQTDKKTCRNGQSSNMMVELSSSSRLPHSSDVQHKILTVGRTTEGTNSGWSCNENSASCRTTIKKLEYQGVQGAGPSCVPVVKHTDLCSAQDQNAITLNQGRGKQVKLVHSAHQVEQNQNELKYTSGYASETHFLSKLPLVLIIHLKRSVVGHVKVRGHVRFKEVLDVGPFMDPSSEDKDNFSYRLVGVIEHRGGVSADVGHYVAYVRPSHQQQSNAPSSWFFASDSDIREVPLEDVLMCEAYILFYERMEKARK